MRYEILDYLNRIYPRAVEEIEIISVFYRLYDVKKIERNLYYLHEKGYIDILEVEIPYLQYKKKKLFKISPKGIDLLEKRIKDESVPIPEEE